jgi:hypothetical protein
MPIRSKLPAFPCAGTQTSHAPTRRDFIYGLGSSLGSVALTALLAEEASAEMGVSTGPHHPARAKQVIFLMMEGGPSHIDTFDPKPALDRRHLERFTRKGAEKSAMESGSRYYVKSPFRFRRVGQSGADMAENWESWLSGR